MSKKQQKAADDNQTKEWIEFVAAMKGRHAERMTRLLDELPDKQFRIVYPKLLEFIVPKMQRAEVMKTTNNYANVLQIQIVQSPEQISEYRKINDEFDVFNLQLPEDIDYTETDESEED